MSDMKNEGVVPHGHEPAHWCVICKQPNDEGLCVGAGDGSGQKFAHKRCYDVRAKGRAEERAAVASYMRREAKHFAIAGEGLAEPGKNFMRVVGGAIEGLAGFFEDGGHLK